ncbi:hypothetical protein SAMN05192529_10743 [Arachidicoccus rhizosphaerae]|jgi:AAA+ ATPase superfamily predicted ATPase|uniref:ATPase domain-containing protein n=1 Tax=Arachidicoccus rhizosphaerae TaxID=551991 RepID=A0A1H3Y1D5_9BACT|nr:ATP-binding protein [Arachidicoccus rhizosphaerae]SEA05330.1 hypothetical protein SAMN05192529_10743 [Arachidicoccus rhizosphaerae]
MNNLVGREKEIDILQALFESKEAELVAIYGRRRIGKTFLIREVMNKAMTFEIVGEHKGALKTQLTNFSRALIQYGSSMAITPPNSWSDAFFQLSKHLEFKARTHNGKQVVFLDEFPWLNTPRSGFLSAFDHWWNSWGNKQDYLIVVICGSAAAWMIRNIVYNRGGLHNRITQRINLKPFTLGETEDFLRSRNIKLGHFQMAQIYMALGGIAAYLKLLKRGESVAQAIDRLCFDPDGPLIDEFQSLYQSLFEDSGKYIRVIKLLAKNTNGFSRSEIAKSLDMSSGGGLSVLLDELEASGFIASYRPYHLKKANNLYKVGDEFSLFYLKFMENKKHSGMESWHKIAATASWKSWSGLAFERVCLKHLHKIKEALGLRAIQTNSSSWKSGNKEAEGAQIDLLIERGDFVINLCEIKFSESVFTIDKKYANELRNKRARFIEESKTRKSVMIVMITSFGVNHNENYLELIQNEVKLEDLF